MEDSKAREREDPKHPKRKAETLFEFTTMLHFQSFRSSKGRPYITRTALFSQEQNAEREREIPVPCDIEELEENAGYILIYRNNPSSWVSAPLIVPKPEKEGFRFTVQSTLRQRRPYSQCLMMIQCSAAIWIQSLV